jgi:hypothetical protein
MKNSPVYFFMPLYLLVFLLSCQKEKIFPITDNQEYINKPPEVIADADKFVSSKYPFTILQIIQADGTSVKWVRNWSIQWTCTKKPSGAPGPVIFQPQAEETIVNGLVPGEYEFRVELKNVKGISGNAVNVTVVEDTMSGKTMVFDQVPWINWQPDCLFPDCNSTYEPGLVIEGKPFTFIRKPGQFDVSIDPGISAQGSNIIYSIASIDNFQILSIKASAETSILQQLEGKKATVTIKFP